jgi:hypothetical protein
MVMEEDMELLDTMIKEAVENTVKIEAKMNKLKMQPFTLFVVDKWNRLATEYACALERERAFYEMRGRM